MEDRIRRLAPNFFVATIVGLGIFSGVYTFSGIELIVKNINLAIILACVIQLTIASLVIGLPFTSGLFRILALGFYLGFLLISSATAYVYLFNRNLGTGSVMNYDTKFVDLASACLGELKAARDNKMANQREKMEVAKYEMEEEKETGAVSGRGSGQGAEYARKMKIYIREKVIYENLEATVEAFDRTYGDVTAHLGNSTTSNIYSDVVGGISTLSGLIDYDSLASRDEFDVYMDALRHPAREALSSLTIDSILSSSPDRTAVLMTIVWSIIFDAASLIMGLLWFRMKSRPKPFLESLLDKTRYMIHMKRKFARLRREIDDDNAIVGVDLKADEETREIINDFGTQLVAFCNASAINSPLSPVDILKTVVAKIKVLNFYGERGFQNGSEAPVIGILHDDIMSDPNREILENVIAAMADRELFLINGGKKAYQIDNNNRIALQLVNHIVNNPHLADPAHVREIFPGTNGRRRLGG